MCWQVIMQTNFPRERAFCLTAAEQGVKLPMETSRFSNFNETDYSTVMQNLANGTITVKDRHHTEAQQLWILHWLLLM